MKLTDPIWKNLKGGYGTLYDVSISLRNLENSNSLDDINNILDELWNELHHQGDVGLASYLALPQLIRIGIKKNHYDWRLIGLCNLIELQRHNENNPELPSEYSDYYKSGIQDLKNFVITNLSNEMDTTNLVTSLSTLATCHGRIKLGKVIMELEDEDLLNEFMEQF